MKQYPVFLIIMGMHRSGTSCLTGSLQQCGVQLGEVVEWAPHNLKGNRENIDVMALNNSVLSFSGGSWDKPPVRIKWSKTHEAERDRIIESLKSHLNNIYGFKDPRAIFTLPFWKDGVDNIKLVASFRHPLLVAQSLNARNKVPLSEGLKLWKAYNVKLYSYLQKDKFPLISFDVDKHEYKSAIRRISKYFGLPKTASNNELFFDHTLKHQKLAELADELPSDIGKLYDDLSQIYINQKTL